MLYSAATIRSMAKRHNIEIVGELRSKKQKFYWMQVIKTFMELDSEAIKNPPTFNYGAGYDFLNMKNFNKQLNAEINAYMKDCQNRFSVGSIDWIRQEFKILAGSRIMGYVFFSPMRERFFFRNSTDGFMVSRPIKENTLTAALDALTNLYLSQLKVAS